MVHKHARFHQGASRRNLHLQIQTPEWRAFERTHDHVVASQSPQGKIKNMEVVEDIVSRPRRAVSFLVGRDIEIQESREVKLPQALPGQNGGKARGGTEGEEEEEQEVRRVEKEVTNVIEAKEQRDMDAVEGYVTGGGESRFGLNRKFLAGGPLLPPSLPLLFPLPCGRSLPTKSLHLS